MRSGSKGVSSSSSHRYAGAGGLRKGETRRFGEQRQQQYAAPPDALHMPRLGILHCSQLLAADEAKQLDKDFPTLERSCVIRFPPDVAAILRKRLAATMNAEIAQKLLLEGASSKSGGGGSGSASVVSDAAAAAPAAAGPNSNGLLGLTIQPTPDEDFRRFDIFFERQLGKSQSIKRYSGILVELPALLESYKSLEGELLFKSGDLSQMLYVYDPGDPCAADMIAKIKKSQYWEWHAGLTPGTHRIRCRKFRNWRVFEKADVAAAERAICDVLRPNGPVETMSIEASSEEQMEIDLVTVASLATAASRVGGDSETVAGGSSSTTVSSKRPASTVTTGGGHNSSYSSAFAAGEGAANVVAVIGPNNPIFRAALEGKPPSKLSPVQLKKPLMRDLCANRQEFDTSLEARLKYATSSETAALAAHFIHPDGPIPDNLDDILFGTLAPTMEEDQTDTGFSLEELGHLNAQSDTSSQASSIGAFPLREKGGRTSTSKRGRQKDNGDTASSALPLGASAASFPSEGKV